MSQSAVGELFEVSLEDQIEFIKDRVKNSERYRNLSRDIGDKRGHEEGERELGCMRAVLRTLEGLR